MKTIKELKTLLETLPENDFVSFVDSKKGLFYASDYLMVTKLEDDSNEKLGTMHCIDLAEGLCAENFEITENLENLENFRFRKVH